jgi:hypothetical protein
MTWPYRRKKRKRKLRHPRAPVLDLAQILDWADAFHAQHGRWPTLNSGRVIGTLSESWRRVDSALRLGLRGLPGGTSLAKMLVDERGVRNHTNLPRLTVKRILSWADAHYERTGLWPKETSGAIPEAPGEGWHAVDRALRAGVRGLPKGLSLARLLAKHRRYRNIHELPRISFEQILIWADSHHERTGSWPNSTMGTVREAPAESWSAINAALQLGRRGLPGGCSLVQLLAEHRGCRNPKRLPKLTHKTILNWCDDFHERTGDWPSRKSGMVNGKGGETWPSIDRALMSGLRGLPRGWSLFRLLRKHRGLKLVRRPRQRRRHVAAS